jgi:hypothetical protein
MNVIAVITEAEEVEKILRHLVKGGRGRPAVHRRDSIQLRSTDNPSPCWLRAMGMSLQLLLSFSKGGFLEHAKRVL